MLFQTKGFWEVSAHSNPPFLWCQFSCIWYSQLSVQLSVQYDKCRRISSCRILDGQSKSSSVKIIPWLELAAAALLVKVDKMLQEELSSPTDRSVFLAESTSVLKYISNDHNRFHIYVANRASRIREGTQVSQWRYIKVRRDSWKIKDESADQISFGNQQKSGAMNTLTEFICGNDPEVREATTVNSVMKACKKKSLLTICSITFQTDWS